LVSIRFTVSEVAEQVAEDFGTIDFVVHSLANGPEVMKPLLETSRYGYLAAMSASSYSLISLCQVGNVSLTIIVDASAYFLSRG
jgi:enoyl-[acyl-carrier protein] reductase I